MPIRMFSKSRKPTKMSPRLLNKIQNRGHISLRCSQGHNHRSKIERQHCDALADKLRSGEIISYDVEVSYPLFVNGMYICDHRVDFLVANKNFTCHVEEVKGFIDPVWELKAKLFQVLFPDIPYKVFSKTRRGICEITPPKARSPRAQKTCASKSGSPSEPVRPKPPEECVSRPIWP